MLLQIVNAVQAKSCTVQRVIQDKDYAHVREGVENLGCCLWLSSSVNSFSFSWKSSPVFISLVNQ